ncbi:MAG: DnaJ domain-containing protein [Vampirovibrio sp.]
MTSSKNRANGVSPLINYYNVLGLENYASPAEVRKAYKGLVKTTHPDVVPPELRDSATAEFKTILLAYTILNHPGKKQYYDEQLHSMMDALTNRLQMHQAKKIQDVKEAPALKEGVAHANQEGESSDAQEAPPKAKRKKAKSTKVSKSYAVAPVRPTFWKKWHTLYIIESENEVWKATWEGSAKQRQEAHEKGILFKCVNFYTQAVLQHVQVPFDVIPAGEKAGMIKLAIDRHIQLHLHIKATEARSGGWFSFGGPQRATDQARSKNPPSPWVEEEAEDERDEFEFEASHRKTPRIWDDEEDSEEADSEASLLNLAIWEAVLGTVKEVTIPYATETASLSVPAGVQPDQILRLMHDGEAHEFQVQIQIPKSLSEEERHCYELLQHLSES